MPASGVLISGVEINDFDMRIRRWPLDVRTHCSDLRGTSPSFGHHTCRGCSDESQLGQTHARRGGDGCHNIVGL